MSEQLPPRRPRNAFVTILLALVGLILLLPGLCSIVMTGIKDQRRHGDVSRFVVPFARYVLFSPWGLAACS